MKKVLILFLIALLPTSLIAQNSQTAPASSVVLNHATVIDVTGAPSKSGMTVIITGNLISGIGKTGKVRLPKNAQVIDAAGKYLMPGLWDMHVHALQLDRVNSFLPLFIANGITGIRDMGTTEDGFANLAGLRKEIADGVRIGPRIIAAGRILDGAKPAVPRNSIPFATEAEARAAVRFLKQKGADFIKIYDGVPHEQYYAIIDEAKKQNLSVVGHIPTEITAFEASDAGQISFEHLGNILESCSTLAPQVIGERVNALVKPSGRSGDFSHIPARIAERTKIELETYSEQKCRDLFARFVKNETWQVPTLEVKRILSYVDDGSFYNDPRMKYVAATELEKWKPENHPFLKYRTSEYIRVKKLLYEKEFDLVREMHRAGVKFLLGTDIPGAYTYPGFTVHDEIALFAAAGFTPLEALQTATVNPAKFLGLEKSLGTVEKGKTADLVLLDADPLENISNTKKIFAVIVGGRYLSKEKLQEMLRSVEQR